LNRESNYKFDYDTMLALNGNTAPYMLYAHARIRGIERKAAAGGGGDAVGAVTPRAAKEERVLMRELVKFGEATAEFEEALAPHLMCNYLFDLSKAFNAFYENCPVNGAPVEDRASRTALCRATATTLRVGLSLLGIEALERL